MTTEPDPLPSGFRLSRWVVEAHLGDGPMGRVYGACDTKLGIHVAVYVLRCELRVDEGLTAFYEWVARARQGDLALAPPCDGVSLPVVDVGEVGGLWFAVLTRTESQQGKVLTAAPDGGRPTRG